ncbi:MAG TPA: prepilin-type N-terminal cleavage/methylation domain-containing protein [Terriglobales bacterium]|nr:prepilin-type N-terminal cleavage/methylation domain-containing protein [Terriglobales bacterium]
MMRMRKIRFIQSEKGITLLEVMASMVIFSLGLLMLVPLMLATITANDSANDMSRATLFAQQKLEQLRSASILASGNDTIEDMSRTWTVETVTSSLKKITVNVTWQDQMSKSHHVQTITYEID